MHASSGTGYARLISFSRLTHMPVKAIRGQTDMGNLGKTYHQGRSHPNRAPTVAVSPGPPRRSVWVMRFAVYACFPDGAGGLD
jgi:hypothetical protein